MTLSIESDGRDIFRKRTHLPDKPKKTLFISGLDFALAVDVAFN
jgi:hypothetical protein